MRVLFYYRGSEHIGLESIMSYVQSKGHLVELIYEPALGDNGYIDIPWLNNFFYNGTPLPGGMIRTGVNDQRILEIASNYDAIGITSIFSQQETQVLHCAKIIKKQFFCIGQSNIFILI